MARPQVGICSEPNLHGLYMMFNALDGKETLIRQALAKLPRMFDEYAEQFSESVVSGVVAIGTHYWDIIYPNSRPKLLKPFPSMESEDRSAPTAAFDLFVQIRSDRADVNHIVGTQLCHLLDGCVDLVEQVKGFRFLDGRDLTGFVDGTENPRGPHRREVALVGAQDDDEMFVAGSYLHIQRYRHDMKKWNKMVVKDQEDVIGRSKIDNIEYSSDVKPLTSHVKRTGLKDADGNSIEIMRQSMPYGHMKAQGLYFISCCHTPENFEIMLRSMIYGDGHGHHDHLLNYTEAETGAAFFAPSINYLQAEGEMLAPSASLSE